MNDNYARNRYILDKSREQDASNTRFVQVWDALGKAVESIFILSSKNYQPEKVQSFELSLEQLTS